MGSNSYFSTPIPTWKPFAAAQLPTPQNRKRKRDNELKDKGKNNSTSSSAQNIDITSSPAGQASSSQPRLIHTLDDIAQFRVAGHKVTEAVPSPPFPHRQPRKDEADQRELHDNDLHFQTTSQGVGEDIKPNTRGRTLRQQHMSVLTTILHRCVMQKDFLRARRALGLLLRHEAGGQPFDVRTGATWGLGAEILMHSTGEKTLLRPIPTMLANDHSTVHEDDSESLNLQPSEPNRRTFELTRRYLESLSVQYAYNSAYPRSFSAIDFKLAMFELWIYTLQEEIRKADIDHGRLSSGENNDSFVEDPMPDLFLRSDSPLREILDTIINEAYEIQSQMQTLMQAPIYSNRPDYLKLYKGVGQWITDLKARVSQEPSPPA